MRMQNTRSSTAVACLLLIAIFGMPRVGFSQESQRQPLRLDDDSDWWSITRGSDSINGAKEQNRRISNRNLRIQGIELEEGLLEHAAGKLGRTSIVSRGDGGESRSQACYVSKAGETKTYLIFETGEIDLAVHLFQGPAWKGSENCLATELVHDKTSTATGIRLGQSIGQVVAILGKPSKRQEGELVYLFGTRERNSAEGLQKARKAYPQMTEKEIQSNFLFYDLSVLMVFKFKDSRLSYLAISKSETY